MEQDILSFILTGSDHARTAETISQIANLSRRTVTLQIEEARRRGTLICSSDRGYWLPETPAEARHTIGRLRRRAVNRLQTAQQMELGLIAFDAAYMGQQKIEME